MARVAVQGRRCGPSAGTSPAPCCATACGDAWLPAASTLKGLVARVRSAPWPGCVVSVSMARTEAATDTVMFCRTVQRARHHQPCREARLPRRICVSWSASSPTSPASPRPAPCPAGGARRWCKPRACSSLDDFLLHQRLPCPMRPAGAGQRLVLEGQHRHAPVRARSSRRPCRCPAGAARGCGSARASSFTASSTNCLARAVLVRSASASLRLAQQARRSWRRPGSSACALFQHGA